MEAVDLDSLSLGYRQHLNCIIHQGRCSVQLDTGGDRSTVRGDRGGQVLLRGDDGVVVGAGGPTDLGQTSEVGGEDGRGTGELSRSRGSRDTDHDEQTKKASRHRTAAPETRNDVGRLPAGG